jgi:CRISPR associated protein, Cas1 family
MGRPRCDPIDVAGVLDALASENVTLLAAYRDYASTASRPYARSSWQGIIDRARREAGPIEKQIDQTLYLQSPNREYDDASLDEASDAHWSKFLQVKPRVLTMVADNASLRVKGGALVVCDGDHRLVYDAGARKAQAIVMMGWSGMVTIEAMRWACDHKVAIILLDWMRDFLTIVGASAKPSAAFIRAHVLADPLTVARAILAAKINAHESWARESGQVDKWIFCLTTARLAEDQEIR